ncbi:MAG: DUF1553 domain-containing protein, partial [Pirellulales bacterium]
NAVLRPLSEMDGDFELQAPAAGGSHGVLVSPWQWQGEISVTTAAQSPFKNLYPLGKVGASIPAGAGHYRMTQAIHPSRSHGNCRLLHVNLDLRPASPDAGTAGMHRFWLGDHPDTPSIEVLISSQAVFLPIDGTVEQVSTLQPHQWHNLQLAIDLENRTFSGQAGLPGNVAEFNGKPFAPGSSGQFELVGLDPLTQGESQAPAIDVDNLGIQEARIGPVSTDPPVVSAVADGSDAGTLKERLQTLTGIDGDLELQTKDTAPASPWNPGPNSDVKLSTESQSPYHNQYAPGELGLHLPNRGEYDGFGLTLANLQPDQQGRLFVSFDFRCANQEAGGGGSWRYYLGHGPGNSAAIELFFNGSRFFRRSADAREAVCPLVIGEWYQVRLTLDLHAKTYRGILASPTGQTDFEGEFAAGWDGSLDYTFIDSYGHLGGVRPSLDADNFVIGDKPLQPFDAPAPPASAVPPEDRRKQAAQLRQQLAAIQSKASQQQQELNSLLADGPFAMAYGMSEGTPHNVHLQLRGEPDQPGQEVPRGFIKVLGGGPLPAETAGSGRLELAHWLTHPDNPLTARVMANRLWQYHFGRGIVQTPNDFGVRGLPPTHPELLDHLAARFIESGWSVKAMHRLIMLSDTYQQASQADADQPVAASDTADLYLTFPRRRLSAEEIRDAILAVSGELDATPAREHPFPSPIGFGYSQHGPFNAVYDHKKRSVYLMTQRLKRHPFLALFDGADPNATTAQRLGTTVPTQALFFLNDPFIHAKAEKWAARLLAADEPRQIELAWRGALGRSPTKAERAEAQEFLAAYQAELAAIPVDNVQVRALSACLRTLLGSNEFLHID